MGLGALAADWVWPDFLVGIRNIVDSVSRVFLVQCRTVFLSVRK